MRCTGRGVGRSSCPAAPHHDLIGVGLLVSWTCNTTRSATAHRLWPPGDLLFDYGGGVQFGPVGIWLFRLPRAGLSRSPARKRAATLRARARTSRLSTANAARRPPSPRLHSVRIVSRDLYFHWTLPFTSCQSPHRRQGRLRASC